MNQWVKLGCGHLVVLSLFLFAGICSILLIRGDNVTVTTVGVLGSIMLGAAGLGGGLLFYLWRTVWPRMGEEEAEMRAAGDASPEDTSARPRAVNPERVDAETLDMDAVNRDRGAVQDGDAAEGSNGEVSKDVPDGGLSDSVHRAKDTNKDQPERIPRLDPDERPWEERPGWHDRHIESRRGSFEDGNNRIILLVGFVFILVGVGAGIANPEKWPLTVMCVAAGGLVSGIAAYRMWRTKRFGPTTFEMDTFPGVLGGPLCGVVHTGVQANDAPEDGFYVKVSCYHRRVTRNSENHREVNRTLLWRDEQHVSPKSATGSETLDVPVAFDIPDGPPPSTPQKLANRYMWVVEVSADVPGIDYASVIEVPVFPVMDDGTAPVEEYRQYVQERTEGSSLSRGITVDRPHPGHIEVTFGRSRRPWVTVFMTIMALVFVPLTIVALLDGGLFVSILLGAFGVASVWGALSYGTHQSSIRVKDGTIRVRAGIIGRETETVIPCDALNAAKLVTDGGSAYYLFLDCDRAVKGPEDQRTWLRTLVRTVSGGKTPTGESWDVYWKRYGMTDDRVVAAQMITDHSEGEWIATQIEEAAAESARFA